MKRSILAAGLAVAGLAAAPAFAQSANQQFYVGIGAGGSHASGGCSAGVSCDNNDTAIKVYGGWMFTNDLSAELTYYNFGTFKAAESGVQASLKPAYWGLGGAWRPTFSGTDWGGVLRAGAAYNQTKLDVTGFDEQTRNSWHPYLGAGVSYNVSKNVKVELDYDWTRAATQFTDPTSQTTVKGTTNVSAYTVGASFAF
jgi:opacity protein-like surface antigen